MRFRAFCIAIGLGAVASGPVCAAAQGASHLDQAIDRALAEHRIVGAVVLVAKDGQVIYRRAAGYADRENGTVMQTDTLFRLASMSKPIVSVAVLKLVAEGRLRLDDPIDRWLPDFRPRLADGQRPAITVRHLLTHTAGLSYGFFQEENGPYYRAGVSDGMDQPGLSMAENLRRIASVPLSYRPGTSWGYSMAIDVLGEVAARAAGVSLERLVQDKVSTPLRLEDTSFRALDRKRLAAVYADKGAGQDQPPRMDDHLQVVPFIPQFAGIRFSPARAFDHRSFASGGAGMVGSAEDYLKFLDTLRRNDGTVLPAEMVSAMRQNQIGTFTMPFQDAGWGFGFGFAVLLDPVAARTPQSAGTFQWGGAYGHSWFVDPARGLTVVALTNTAIEGMSGQFPKDIRDAVYADFVQ